MREMRFLIIWRLKLGEQNNRGCSQGRALFQPENRTNEDSVLAALGKEMSSSEEVTRLIAAKNDKDRCCSLSTSEERKNCSL